MEYFEIIKLKEAPTVCNIPHGSIEIPLEFKKDFSVSDQELEIEAKKIADLYTETLFAPLLAEFGGIISKISRIVVDTERFEDDKNEPMSKVGMGALYTKNGAGESIRNINEERKNLLINEVYQPYNLAWAELAKECLSKFGQCLILDCHSFPSEPRPYEPDQSKDRPDICLGTDEFHTPENLKTVFLENFKNEGFSVKYDSPFAGTFVPKEYFYKNALVSSIMIEINRKLYMDEENLLRNDNFDDLSNKICRIIQDAYESF
jgi:N-formylglutamate deformylase